VVALESYVVSGEYVFASEDLRGYAEQVTSARFQSSLLIDHLHATLLLVGCFALYAYLTGSRAERWALAGLLLFCVEVFSVGIDTGATLSSVPAAQAYLAGQRDALDGALLLDDFTALPPCSQPEAWQDLVGWIEEQDEEDTQGFLRRKA
jgi:hypothetical protein